VSGDAGARHCAALEQPLLHRNMALCQAGEMAGRLEFRQPLRRARAEYHGHGPRAGWRWPAGFTDGVDTMSAFPRAPLSVLAAGVLAVSLIGPAAASDDDMLKLATKSGCMTCHHIEPGAKGPNGMAPIGPAWQDVATRYKNQPDALQRLTVTVLAGSSPYASHWKDKVSGLAMPPNEVAISKADAGKLVGWILSLEKAP
jgi:cytochrome c